MCWIVLYAVGQFCYNITLFKQILLNSDIKKFCKHVHVLLIFIFELKILLFRCHNASHLKNRNKKVSTSNTPGFKQMPDSIVTYFSISLSTKKVHTYINGLCIFY